jgi:hypothetical protein
MSDLNYVLAKSGVKLNNNLLYTETFLNPKPEFDKIEYKPNSMYGGQNRFMIIDDWASSLNISRGTIYNYKKKA